MPTVTLSHKLLPRGSPRQEDEVLLQAAAKLQTAPRRKPKLCSHGLRGTNPCLSLVREGSRQHSAHRLDMTLLSNRN